MARTERKFTPVEPQFFKFDEVGQTVEGTYLGVEDFTYKNGNPGKRYVFEREDGTKFSLNGSAVLDRQMQHVDVDMYLRITFTGLFHTDTGQEGKTYSVEVSD